MFQTTRTQKMLGGMAPPPTPVYVFRCRRWVVVSTKDILPGDLISLAFCKRSASPSQALAQAQAPAAGAGAAGAAGAAAGAGQGDWTSWNITMETRGR